MLQPSPRVFQSNCSHHRSSHLPWMMFWSQSNNSRRRCWRCVWRLDEERCVTTMRWCWSSDNWSKTNEWKKKQQIVVSNWSSRCCVPGMLEYENTKCNFNIVEYNKEYFNTKIEKHTTHFMLQPSPRVFQWNCSHQRLSHLPCMVFWFQSNNSRKRCWRCVWRLKCIALRHNEMVLIEW